MSAPAPPFNLLRLANPQFNYQSKKNSGGQAGWIVRRRALRFCFAATGGGAPSELPNRKKVAPSLLKACR
jgi:hypothetical protein